MQSESREKENYLEQIEPSVRSECVEMPPADSNTKSSETTAHVPASPTLI